MLKAVTTSVGLAQAYPNYSHIYYGSHNKLLSQYGVSIHSSYVYKVHLLLQGYTCTNVPTSVSQP